MSAEEDELSGIAICGRCRFWDDLGDDRGLCVRYAPRPQALDEDSEEGPPAAVFPMVAINQWCGEFAARHIAEDADEFPVAERISGYLERIAATLGDMLAEMKGRA